MPQATYRDVVENLIKDHPDLDPRVVYGVLFAESSHKPEDPFPGEPTKPSTAGARGPMQLMPGTAKRRGVNIDDPYDNLRGGIGELADLHREHKGNLALLLRRYNGSPRASTADTDKYVTDVLGYITAGGGAATDPAAKPPTRPLGGSPSIDDEAAGSFLGIPGGLSRARPVTRIGEPPPDPRRIDPTLGSLIGRNVTIPAAMAAGGKAGWEFTPGDPRAKFVGSLVGAGGAGLTAALTTSGAEQVASTFDPAVAPPDPEEELRRAAAAGTSGMTGEAYGQGIVGIGGRLMRPFAKDVRDPRLVTEATEQFRVPSSGVATQVTPAGVGTPPPSVLDRGRMFLADTLGSWGPDMLDPRKTGKVLFSPAEASANRFPIGLGQNVGESALFGTSPLHAQRAARQAKAESDVLGILGSLTGPGGRQAERVIGQGQQEAIKAARTRFKDAAKTLYDRWRPGAREITAESPLLDAHIEALGLTERGQVGPQSGLRIAEAVAALAPFEDEALEAAAKEATEKASGAIAAAGRQALPPARTGFGVPQGATASEVAKRAAEQEKAIVKAQGLQTAAEKATAKAEAARVPPMNAEQLHNTVSSLGRLMKQLNEAAKLDPVKYNHDAGVVTGLYKAAQKDLDNLLAKTSPTLHQDYLKATKFYRLGSERLINNEEIIRIVDANPEEVVKMLARPRQSTAINAVRAAIGEAKFAPIRSEVFQRLVDGSKDKYGRMNWTKLRTDFTKLGDDTLDALTPPRAGMATGAGRGKTSRASDDIVRIARLMERLGERSTGDIGRQSIQIIQGMGALGAIGTTASALGDSTSTKSDFALPVGLITAVSSPYIAGKILSSDIGRRYLLEGLQAPKGSAAMAKGFTQLANWLYSDQGGGLQAPLDDQVGRPPRFTPRINDPKTGRPVTYREATRPSTPQKPPPPPEAPRALSGTIPAETDPSVMSDLLLRR